MLRRNLLIALAPLWAATAPSHPEPASSPGVPGAPLVMPPGAPAHGPVPSKSVAEVLREAAPGALERLAVIGASASAGFLLPTDLGEAIEFLLLCEHEPVLRLADSRFFTAPDAHAQEQVVRALAHEATAVVAIDFLFWFSYGAVRGGDAGRERLLERGLDYLDSFDCPVLTSTIPDMSAAVGKMLWPSQVPSLATLEALNRRIEAWALEREHVVLVSLPDWHAQLLAREGFDIAGKTWPPVPTTSLLQYDELHPNVDGISLIACKVLESLVAGGVDVDPAAIELDPARVAGPVHARLAGIVARR